MNKELLLPIDGMHCVSCQERIEKALKLLPGVIAARANYAKNTVFIHYDPAKITLSEIENAIVKVGYTVQKKTNPGVIAGLLFVFFAILLLADFTGSFDMNAALGGQVTYLLLFTIGLFTSLHCMGMCGGILLSQTVSPDASSRAASLRPALLYNLGRVTSYTLLGGLVGALGSVISLSPAAMGAITIFAGLFMIFMGLNMAGFSLFRRYLRLPAVTFLSVRRPDSPFAVGLVNGLMPCGPLQTMQLYALSTGGAAQGAAAMLIFSLGTVPLMLFFGSITSFMSKGLTSKILRFSGVLVIVLGLIMSNRGLALSGFNLFPSFTQSSVSSAAPANKAEIKDGVQVITMSANNKGYVPNVLYIQKGVPVKWIIKGEQINSCNNEIIVPSQSIRKKLTTGETMIEFTPGSEDINFSCWMGMIRGIFKVVDDVAKVNVATSTVSLPSSSGCGGDCCAGPASQQSIYGPNLSQVATDRLIKKNANATIFKGIGFEFEPLIVVSEQPGIIRIDLSAFDQPDGQWEIIDFSKKSVVYTFEGNKKAIDVRFDAVKPGVYGIFKDRQIKGLVEYVENVERTDLEAVRKKYF